MSEMVFWWGDSLRDIEYLINEDGEIKPYELSEGEGGVSEEELDAIFKELNELSEEEQKQSEEKDEQKVGERFIITLKNKIKNIKNVYIQKLDKLLFHVQI